MTFIRRFVHVAALSAVLALAGCTTTSVGSPMPRDEATTTTSPETTSTEPSSERPRDIKLDGKDPCGLIPQADWPTLGIKGPGAPSDHPDFNSPQCHFSGVGNVALVVTAGIEIWTEDKYNATIEDVEPIDGFHTITVASNVSEETCWAVVDVTDGQSLMTTVIVLPNDINKPEPCESAYQLAESAMKTLVAS